MPAASKIGRVASAAWPPSQAAKTGFRGQTRLASFSTVSATAFAASSLEARAVGQFMTRIASVVLSFIMISSAAE